jgi:hypothetical protein
MPEHDVQREERAVSEREHKTKRFGSEPYIGEQIHAGGSRRERQKVTRATDPHSSKGDRPDELDGADRT